VGPRIVHPASIRPRGSPPPGPAPAGARRRHTPDLLTAASSRT